jgi:putative RNA 2'-phosphotransferase
MTRKETVKTSKFLSLILRHEPERVGLKLDSAGWVAVDVLLEAVNRHGTPLSREQLAHIVATSEKKRFAVSEDGQSIRANQGHSVEVELGYAAATPPELLYHGTAEQFVEAIRKEGLSKMERHHVHLTEDKAMTMQVATRRGRPVLLTIHAGDMHRGGHTFYRSANNVWLVDHVQPEFITFP